MPSVKKEDALVELLENMQANMGVAVHTAFRKGCFAPQAHTIWQAMRDMPRDDWAGAIDWILYSVEFERILKLAKRRANAKR